MNKQELIQKFASNLEFKLDKLIDGEPTDSGWCDVCEEVIWDFGLSTNGSLHLWEILDELHPRDNYPVESTDQDLTNRQMFFGCKDKFGTHKYGVRRIKYAREYIKKVRDSDWGKA